MVAKKKSTSILEFLAKVLKSKVAQSIAALVILSLATLGMFMLDDTNYIREENLQFLQSNLVLAFMKFFGIERLNIMRDAWVIFFIVSAFLILVFVGNVVRHKVIQHGEDKKKVDLFYYISIAVTFVAFIFFAYMFGALDSVVESKEVFLNLLYTLLICILFIAIVPVSLVLIYLIGKVLVYCIVVLFTYVKKFGNEVYKTQNDVIDYGVDVTGEVIDENSAEKVFPALVRIDEKGAEKKTENTEITLNELALQFQSFAANHHKIYYELPLIRSFFAGLGTSRLIILEGLSGTGKSMLPRMFSEFTGAKAFFAPVQATWRDKTDVLGFYSEFSKTFKTTQFLENLYSASYTDKTNLMVLDEMNLSRIEYYFADFLSVMEYPPEDWKIRVHEAQIGQTLPKKLEGGLVTVPTNTWFIGTANTDDSTFTITDKVYDRAVIIDFEEKATPIESDYSSSAVSLSAEKLAELYTQAENNVEYRLTKEETDKFLQICEFMKDAFNIRFGNRIMVQIESFVPIYVALGGSKEEALDFMFARKILRKVDGMFEDYVKEELINLSKLITTLYGKDTFKQTEKLIAKYTKRLV